MDAGIASAARSTVGKAVVGAEMSTRAVEIHGKQLVWASAAPQQVSRNRGSSNPPLASQSQQGQHERLRHQPVGAFRQAFL